MRQTALTAADAYKLGHPDMWPKNCNLVVDNWTPRSMRHFQVPDEYRDDMVVWFGIQGTLLEMLELWQTTFFDKDIETLCTEYTKFTAPFTGPRGFNTNRLRALHKLGYLPIEVKSLPEGSLVPVGVPCFVIFNTDKDFGWVPSFLETELSMESWGPSTSATTTYNYMKIARKYAELTGGSMEFTKFQIHDFSPRGMWGYSASAKSGAGHLVVALGTDNLPAVKYLQDYYKGDETLVGVSISATEHGVMCAGTKEGELNTYKRLLSDYPSGGLAIVSDTYNLWNVLETYVPQLKNQIMSRTADQSGLMKTVLRPDSGDPVKILTGNKSGTYESEKYGVVAWLYKEFGGSYTNKYYATLDPHIGTIYGEAITMQRFEEIFKNLMTNGFASDNFAAGIGSYTYTYVTRDTLGWAMKATYIEVDGIGVEIFKDPYTDSGVKKSAKGLVRVDRVEGRYQLKDQCTKEEFEGGCLETILKNGVMTKVESIQTIRDRFYNEAGWQ